ncbi:MAG: CehA/McbA family metallohydrolase [Bacteroidota bacterium]
MKNYFIFLFTFFAATSSFSQTGIWYKGDLHCHTTYSDGDNSLYEVMQDARNKGFTFFVITDHDNIYTPNAGELLHWADTAYHDDNMLLLYGDEWTTDNGHACIWNANQFPYEEIYQANSANDPSFAAQLVDSLGGLFSVNHPLNDYLLWQYGYDLNFNAMEILNGPVSYILSHNSSVITDTWEPLLLSGRRITAVGGSDMHKLDYWMPSLYPNLGSPSTWVFSETHSSQGIIDGIKNGHVCISNSPTEPHVEFFSDADMNGTYELMMGDQYYDTLNPVTFKIKLLGSSTTNLEFNVIKNGTLLYAQPFAVSAMNPEVTFSDIPGQRSFYRVELLSDGEPVSWTNPIYFGYEPQSTVSVDQMNDYKETDVFPNPVKEFVLVRNRTKEILNVTLINMNGETLSSRISRDEIIKIDIQDLNQGVYFVKVNNNKIDKTFKILKIR